MNKFVPSLVLAAVSAFATTAYAVTVWSPAVTVSKIDVESPASGTGVGEVYLKFSSQAHATSCSKNADGLWVVGGNADTVKQVHATALAAKLSGSTVRVLFNNSYTSVDSCSGGGTVGYPVLRGFELQ